HQVLHTQDEIGIVTRSSVLTHDQIAVGAALGLEKYHVRVRIDLTFRAWVDRGRQLDVTRDQRVKSRVFLGNTEKLDSVEIGKPFLPVVLVSHAKRAHAGREFFRNKWTGAVRLAEVSRTVLDDHEMRRAEQDGEVAVGTFKNDLHLV